MLRLVMLSQTIIVLSGCQMSTDALKSTSTSNELSQATFTIIADEIIGRLAEQIPQNDGTIFLKKDNGSFGKALARALIQRGYVVTTNQSGDGKKTTIPLTYRIDEINGQNLTQLSVKNITLARAYSATAGGAVPASPVSVMRNGG